MDAYKSLSHSVWDCKYHIVFIPKCRRKTLCAELRRHLGDVFRQLAGQKQSETVDGHLMPDHVHMGAVAKLVGIADWLSPAP